MKSEKRMFEEPVVITYERDELAEPTAYTIVIQGS